MSTTENRVFIRVKKLAETQPYKIKNNSMRKKHKVMKYAAARRRGRFASGLAQTPLSRGVHFLLFIELVYFSGRVLVCAAQAAHLFKTSTRPTTTPTGKTRIFTDFSVLIFYRFLIFL